MTVTHTNPKPISLIAEGTRLRSAGPAALKDMTWDKHEARYRCISSFDFVLGSGKPGVGHYGVIRNPLRLTTQTDPAGQGF